MPVRYGFGEGLSYTAFDITEVSFAAKDDGLVTVEATVTNTGEADLEDVEVKDDLTGLEEVIPLLKAGKSRSFITTYVVSEEDALAGTIHNVATAYAEDPSSTQNSPFCTLNETSSSALTGTSLVPYSFDT